MGGGGVNLQCELKMASLACVVGQHEGASRVYHFSSFLTPRLDEFLLLSYGVQLQPCKDADAQCWLSSAFS